MLPMDYSILIPVYNEDVTELVHSLHQQMLLLEQSGELIILDDASPSVAVRKRNQELGKLENVIYRESNENIGRSRARNKLADLSSGKGLLYLDADVSIPSNAFLKQYQDYFQREMVVVGGHYYSKQRPVHSLLLNWNYARKYEAKPAEVRQKNVYRGFISMNFLIPRTWIKTIGFPTNVKGWGHEDTLFGHLLEKKNLSVLHIDNPVLHLGLSEASEYLKKQEEAIQQALVLAERYPGFSYRLMEVHRNLPLAVKKVLHFSSNILIPALSSCTRQTNSPFLLNVYKLIYYNSAILEKDGIPT